MSICLAQAKPACRNHSYSPPVAIFRFKHVVKQSARRLVAFRSNHPAVHVLDRCFAQFKLAHRRPNETITIVVPQFVPKHWWENLLHNQTASLIKAALLYGRRRSGGERLIVDVPYHLRT